MASLTDPGDAKSDSGDSASKNPSAEIVAVSLVLACALQLAENLLPRVPVFPWLKLGLSHLILLPFLLRYGAKPALALAWTRNLLTALVAGTPLTSTLVGMVAATVSVGLVGGALRPLARRNWLGWVGLGVASAAAHNITQLAVVETLLVNHDGFYFQLAPLAIWSLISGTLTALLAAAAMPFWNDLFNQSLPMPSVQQQTHALRPESERLFIAWALAALVLLVVPHLLFQGMVFVVLMVMIVGNGLRLRINPTHTPERPSFLFKSYWRQYGWRPMFGTWPLLVFLAWLHLFHHEGHLIGFLGMTREGIAEFGVHALRLINLSLVSPQLLRHFPQGRLLKMTSPFARGLCLALPSLAGLPLAIPAAARHLWLAWKQAGFRGWSHGLRQFAVAILTTGRNR